LKNWGAKSPLTLRAFYFGRVKIGGVLPWARLIWARATLAEGNLGRGHPWAAVNLGPRVTLGAFFPRDRWSLRACKLGREKEGSTNLVKFITYEILSSIRNKSKYISNLILGLFLIIGSGGSKVSKFIGRF
jgi:hypothetical protein